MQILSNKTYKLLRFICAGDKTADEISRKTGRTAAHRTSELLNNGYIRMTSALNQWQSPGEPITYGVTDSGRAYLEDHRHYITREWLATIRNGILFSMAVSFITTILIGLIKYWLSLP